MPITKEMLAVWSAYEDLQRAFPDLDKGNPESITKYEYWWKTHYPGEKGRHHIVEQILNDSIVFQSPQEQPEQVVPTPQPLQPEPPAQPVPPPPPAPAPFPPTAPAVETTPSPVSFVPSSPPAEAIPEHTRESLKAMGYNDLRKLAKKEEVKPKSRKGDDIVEALFMHFQKKVEDQKKK